MAKEKYVRFTEEGYEAMVATIKRIEALARQNVQIINVGGSCRDLMWTRSKPVVSDETSLKKSTDQDVFTVVFDDYSQIEPGVYLYDEEEGKCYKDWADKGDFCAEDLQWKPGMFYRSESLDMFYASATGVNGVAPSLTVDAVLTDVQNISNKVSGMETKLNRYPVISAEQLADGNTYGLRNGQLELVAWDGYDVMVQLKATATNLAREALFLGKIPNGLDEEMIEEIHSLLGDEIFNDLAVASAATLEMKPQISEKELLEQAKAEYLAFKASMAQNVDTLEVNDIDIVKPKKS